MKAAVRQGSPLYLPLMRARPLSVTRGRRIFVPLAKGDAAFSAVGGFTGPALAARGLVVRILMGMAGLLLVILSSDWHALAADRTIEFNRDIRPILSDKCYRCHGSDATAKGIPLRLDSEAAATADLGDNKHAIVPGNLESSQLVRRITAEDEAVRMPPAYSGLKLTDREIETLRSWITQGAKWQLHWSFIPPKRYPIPAVRNASWPRNPIDHFIFERLDREGLFPAPEAS